VQIDAGLDFLGLGGTVGERGFGLCPGNDPISDQFCYRILDRAQVVDPHRDLPEVRPADHSGAAPDRPVAEGDERMLVASGAFFRVTAEAIREAFTGRAGAKTQPFGEAIIEANRNIHGHNYGVTQCPHIDISSLWSRLPARHASASEALLT
jgi:hypothetical protein